MEDSKGRITQETNILRKDRRLIKRAMHDMLRQTHIGVQKEDGHIEGFL